MTKGMNPEGIAFLIFIAAVIIPAFAVSVSYGEDPSEQPLSFSNRDLKRYENSADHETRASESTELKSSEVRKTKVADNRQQKEKEYWCKRAAPKRTKIQRLNAEIDEKEQELAEENSKNLIQNKKAKTLNKALGKIRKRLKEAEENFSELESEAHRKGVPPGWLRCQFE